MHSTGGSCSRPPGPCPRCHPQCLGLGEGQGGLGSHQGGSAPSWEPLGSTVSCSPLCHVPRPAEPQGQCTPSPASGTGCLAWSLVPASVAYHLEARPSPRGLGCGAAQEAVFAWGAVGGRPEPLLSSAGAESLVPSLPRYEDAESQQGGQRPPHGHTPSPCPTRSTTVSGIEGASQTLLPIWPHPTGHLPLSLTSRLSWALIRQTWGAGWSQVRPEAGAEAGTAV